MATPASDDPLSPGTENWWAPQRRRSWFGVAGGPAAWAVHLSAGWYVSGNACLQGTPTWGGLSGAAVWWLEALVAVVCVGTAAAALVVGVLDWRASGNRRIDEIHATARPDYIAAIEVLVSAAFLLAVCYDALAQLMLPLCERIR